MIDCLPVRTRVAMLEGIERNPIIVGAYTTRDGGICPMLAAHRNGGRTDFISFARAWDHFTDASRARRATRRELRVLRSQLQASLMADDDVDLRQAIAAHRALVRSGEEIDLGAAIAEHRTLQARHAPAPALPEHEIRVLDRRPRRPRLRRRSRREGDYERALEIAHDVSALVDAQMPRRPLTPAGG